MKQQYTINLILFFLVLMASISPAQAEPFSQECKGLATLLSPVEQGRDGWLNAHFLMHKQTFQCTGDKKEPKLTGYRHEALQYMNLDIGTPKLGKLLRISYRLSEGVTLGGGGFLNWGIEEPANPTIVTEKEQKIINTELASITAHTHTGTNFSINYPKGFLVSIEHPANYEPAGDANFDPFDEAYFTSPDKTVEFFVFSPLWGGKPQSYLDTASNETLVDEQSTKGLNTDPYRDKNRDQLLTRRVTVKAKNGDYSRSFVQTRKRSSDFSLKMADLDLVFGIKYKNKEAYEKYREAYLAFKKSLLQFSDE